MSASLPARLRSVGREGRRPPRAPRSLTTGFVAATLLLSACVQPNAPGVQVRAISADLVFGVPDEPPPAEAAPPNAIAALPDPQQVGTAPAAPPPAALPPPPELSPPPAPEVGPPLSRTPACPTAPVSEFPDEPAARNVAADRRPAVGTYRFVQRGTRKGADTANIEIPITGFDDRQFRNVEEASDTAFSFEMVQTDVVSGSTVVTTFSVRTDGTRVSDDELPVAVPGGGTNQSAGQPDRGIAISKIVRIDKEGNESTFSPVTPLLLLPLPVQVNEEFTSTAVDPVTFQSIQYDGKVNAAKRVDACGELVEGFLVTGTQTSSGSTTSRRQFDVTFAPQLGGIPIAEHIDESVGTSILKLDTRIGQLKPDPLPKTKDG